MYSSGANLAGSADPRLPIPGHEDATDPHRRATTENGEYEEPGMNKAGSKGMGEKPVNDDATVVAGDSESMREKKHRSSNRMQHGPQHLATYMEHAAKQRQIEKSGEQVDNAIAVDDLTEDERERLNARRALRMASWAAVFFLITTDILGPFNAPYAFAQLGYVPSVLLYFFLGLLAFFSGIALSYLFGKLDSDRYPVTTYSDIGVRIFGPFFKYVLTFLQTVQLIINVGTLILSNAQSLAQISMNKLCFIVGLVIWMAVGMVLGQIRSLHAYGWVANFAVWINLLIIFTSMGFVAHSPPNYAAAFSSLGAEAGPVVTAAFVSSPLYSQVQGMLQMVFAYGGAMIFPEMMAEMRRPMDFYKGMACAQLLIFACYMMYGAFVYSYQGQFSLPLAYQGVSKYSWQTVGNVFAMITGIIAAGLYGNIGVKVAYINIVEGVFRGPPIMSKAGRFVWSGFVVVYWALAFIIAAAIPQVQTISALVAAACIFQFTYTFPPLMVWGFITKRDALRNSTTWTKAMFHGSLLYNLFKVGLLVIFLAAVATACLGLWAAGTSIKETFAVARATSFSCTPPV